MQMIRGKRVLKNRKDDESLVVKTKRTQIKKSKSN